MRPGRRRTKKDSRGQRKMEEAGERRWRPEKVEEGRRMTDEAGGGQRRTDKAGEGQRMPGKDGWDQRTLEGAVETRGRRETNEFGENHNIRLEEGGGGWRKREKAGWRIRKKIEDGQRKPHKPEEAEEEQM